MIGVTPPVPQGGSAANGDTFMVQNLIIFKNPANLNKGMLEIGDGGMGTVEDTLMKTGFYIGGDITLKASWDFVDNIDFP